MKNIYFREISRLIVESKNEGLCHLPKGLSGYSGETLIGALQRIAKYQQDAGAGDYMEVGVFQGLTLISVASVLDKSMAHGIDNFSQFDEDGTNQTTVNERIQRNQLNNVHLVNSDYEDALEQFNLTVTTNPIGTYFIDGPHDYRSQLMCLQLAVPHLSTRAVIIVDDSNYEHIRLANRDFLICFPEFKLLYQAYTGCHPANMEDICRAESKKGWWNGVNIIVRDDANVLTPVFPPTRRDRSVQVSEHTNQAGKYRFFSPSIMDLGYNIIENNIASAVIDCLKLKRSVKKHSKEIGRFRSMNTFLDDSFEQFNPSVH